MKKIVLAAAAVFILAACNNSKHTKVANNGLAKVDPLYGSIAEPQPIETATAPVISFEKTTHDFGTITIGDKVIYDFKFKNTGKSPLIIANADASCGCTVPEFPKQPIKPGEGGIIKVAYDSKGQKGMQNKVITIVSNAVPTVSELHLTGEIN